jgi:hypothetical protein
MNLKLIQRYKIAVTETGGKLNVIIFTGQNCHAKAVIDRKTKKILFSHAGHIQMPADYIYLEDIMIDMNLYFGRGLLAGSLPELVILDAAYQFILTKDAVKYEDSSVETHDYDVLLSAKSDIPIGQSPSSRSTSVAGGRTKPLRRKTGHRVWI